MAVAIHGDGDRRMPQVLHHGTRVGSLNDEQRGASVPEVVDPQARFEASFRYRLIPYPAAEVGIAQRITLGDGLGWRRPTEMLTCTATTISNQGS